MTDITQNYHKGNLESIEAKRRSMFAAEHDRERILRLVRRRGDEGLTCDEAERLLGLSHQTCSARFSELKRDKLLMPTTRRRPTRLGSMARVLVVV